MINTYKQRIKEAHKKETAKKKDIDEVVEKMIV